ncbi:hypothetical protein HUG10_00410 [Halorarum halophilum]|uniref:PglZ domain-containing protein n=1 Tax=Halorarum halophilum TaxID=2743090 RepID=A0A7D5GXA6_9EURY|nr:hypothetical protein [Halobaculum halophilum]QLG26093.1 hypothetical protein HUG10_00410 [Halobaculum halophilum]
MTFANWIESTREQIAQDGWDGVKESIYELRLGALRRLERFADPGTNVFDHEWDVLLILDGCRVDAMAEVADEYEFLDDPGSHRSVGSASYQWMERTFTDEYADEMARTAHVTANPFTDEFCDPAEWALLDEVWRNAWNEDVGIVPARSVTDGAIRAARERDDEFDRLLVHYMQPHFPSVPEPMGSGTRLNEWIDGREMAWQGLRRGRFTEQEVWNAYVANLRYVLNDVAVLLENLDAEKVVLTADHGNAKGEWGVYGHPNVAINVLREVPWYVTTAIDEDSYEPNQRVDSGAEEDVSVADRLQALGYSDN